MFIQQLKLTQFKNYESEKFTFSKKINCIVGMNGMGKTNLLDAIYYLCVSKSRFAGSDRNLVLKADSVQETFFRLEGVFQKSDKKDRIVAKVRPGKLKEFVRNEMAYDRLMDHIGAYPIVFVVPDDANLMMEGSESRRLLMDNVLSQMSPEYLKALLTYNRVLKQRNSALKKSLEIRFYDERLIQTYNQQLLAPGELIYKSRQEFLELFKPLISDLYKTISGDAEPINCRYKSMLAEKSLEELLLESTEKDKVLGRTTAGIHKDDLIFEMNDLPLKRFASQGQLKSFLLAVKLAQYDILKNEKQLNPILMLDDIFDKLDDNRVAQLLKLLNGENYGQIFLSDTHADRTEDIIRSFTDNYKKFVIKEGRLLK